jgi:polysaccharide biosynthesis protein PslH
MADGNAELNASARLKVLVIDEDFPYPPDAGKRIRTWNLLRRLAARHEVNLLCYGAKDSPAISALQGAGITVHVVPLPGRAGTGWKLYSGLFLNLFSRYPFSVDKHYSQKFQSALDALVQKERWDLLQCEWTPYMRFISPRVKCPILVATHNVECQIWERRAEHASNAFAAVFFRNQAEKMKRFEIDSIRRADAVTAVTEADAETMRHWGAGDATVIPNGADLESYGPAPEMVQPNQILSVSSLDWFPNQDALEYFVTEILPEIRRGNPEAVLSVVGRRPPEAFRKKLRAVPGVEFHGEVEDVRPYLDSASVVVVPLRIGGGSRLKILEALAAGKAVVSTTIGAEGLELTPGKDLVIADDPREFAGSVQKLLNDPGRRRQLGESGRRTVIAKYGWEEIARRLEEVWRRLSRKENSVAQVS